jgi:hypothetical protein
MAMPLTLQEIAEQDRIVNKLQNLSPGEQVVYATWDSKTEQHSPTPLTSRAMGFAYEMHLAGRVCLTQRTNGRPGESRSFDYLATGANPPYRSITERLNGRSRTPARLHRDTVSETA